MSKKTLIVYYSQARGNTKRIAEQIQKTLGFDILSIDTAEPYTGSYEEIVQLGQDEVNDGFKPKLKPIGINISDYDTFIIMTPTWWYTMAPAMLTFLTSYNWSGKTVIPVQTHGGWPGHVIKDIKSICIGAKFKKENAIQFDSTGGDELITEESEICAWIESLK